MSFVINFIFSVLTIIILNFFSKKKSFLVDKKKLKHKSFIGKDLVPLTGGFVIFFSLLILNNYYLIFFFLIFILGVFSDLFLINSALKKFFIQLIIISLFLYFSGVRITNTRIIFLDYLLKYKLFAFLFIVVCLLVLMNGTNFMDGANTLVCGYYILVLLFVIYTAETNRLFYNFNDYYYLLATLIAIFFFNALSKIYLGDSGSFLLSFVIGYYLVQFFNNNLNLIPAVSSVFIILLLWYPAFENLFSIVRKIIKKKQPSSPDNFHLHHLLFFHLKKKLKININFLNTLVGCIINIYNLIIFILGSKLYFHTKYLTFLVIVNILIYLVSYLYLKSKLNRFPI
jgi:UDP-N-acetylmuramyl pentapeptide phosphotransferase/UDP-N-acetylglucosamine-1-phosphate transferase